MKAKNSVKVINIFLKKKKNVNIVKNDKKSS